VIFLYNVVLLLLLLPVLLALLLRYGRRLKTEFFFGFAEKLGSWRLPPVQSSSPLLWIHCASLGEVRAVEPLLLQLPAYRILITTVTYAGYTYAKQRQLSDSIYFAPIDFSFVVNRVFAKVRPAALIIIETELWPGLLHAAKRFGARVIIVNGRLSGKSYPYYRALRPFWKKVLAGVDCVAARATEDAERFAGLGVLSRRITVTGNIKYDRDFQTGGITRKDAALSDDDVLWCCGSTRDGEENILLDVFVNLKEKHPSLKIILAPRHMNRVGVVRRLLEAKRVRYTLLSLGVTGPFDCLLVDRFGELQSLYAISDVTFVGGSLVNKGGQNPIEPAASGKPVLYGPHMENFRSEARILQEAGGGIQVQDAAELYERLDMLCADRQYRLRAGVLAQAAVEEQKGALERTAEIIRSIVPL
jgi:3-deoxy-D-manno-octulosonic-acid transferase